MFSKLDLVIFTLFQVEPLKPSEDDIKDVNSVGCLL